MGIKRSNGLLALLALALAFLLVFDTPMVFAPKIISWPTGTIEVIQSRTFTLQHKFEWDEAGDGFYSVALYWWYNGLDNWHFTVDNYRAYFENEALIECTKSEMDNGDLLSILIRNTVADARNGVFYVDIRLRARGPLGTNHAVTDNHPILYTKLRCNETSTKEETPGAVAIKVVAAVRGVDVSISPSLRHGWTGDNLVYTVLVKNTGNVADNFILNLSDALVWPHGGISNTNTGELDPGENWTGQIWVVVSGSPCNTDNLTVTATSTGDNTVSDSATCQAHNAAAGVDVSISPSHKEAWPGVIDFTVTVTNMGDAWDNYTLAASSLFGWPVSLDNTFLGPISAGGSASTTLHVTLWDNVPVCTTETVTVIATSVHDLSASDSDTCTVHRIIVRGVQVSIEPPDNSAGPGENVTFRVTVTNTGVVVDNYVLTKSDNAGWGPTLSENFLANVENGGNRTVMLSVTIPTGAENGARDRITVVARSQTDNTVENSASCTAHVIIVRGVEVQVTPKVQVNMRLENVTFTITVINKGNVADNYDLTVSDNAGWGPSLSGNILRVPVGENRTTTFSVIIPENATLGTEDNIVVTATSRADNTIKDNDSCIVRVGTTRRVRVSISPGENSAFPGENVTFIVTVTNTGDNSDNYVLRTSDNLHWRLSLADNLMENIAPGGRRTTRLTVSIPENAAPDARDNITVTATSRENENVTDNEICIAHSIAITRGVRVSISPAEKEGVPGDELSYTVTITNTGNIADSYDLTVSDNAGWGPSVSENTIEVPAGENSTATLSVTVHENAAPGTRDRITVTATSRENDAITASASCVGRALTLMRVEVSISPGYRSGSPMDTLYFTVRVTNTGRVADSYNLRTSASGGWLSHVEPSTLALDPGEFDNATLSVLVPSDVREGDTGIVEVRAVSTTDPMVQGADSCRAIVWAAEEGGKLSIPWIQIIIIAALIAGAVFAAGYLTRRRGRGRRYGVMRRGRRRSILRG